MLAVLPPDRSEVACNELDVRKGQLDEDSSWFATSAAVLVAPYNNIDLDNFRSVGRC